MKFLKVFHKYFEIIPPFLLHAFFLSIFFALYTRNISENFSSIDDVALIKLPMFEANFSLASIFSTFKPGNHLDFYPIRDLSYLFDWKIFGSTSHLPFWMGIHNLCLVALSVLLISKILQHFQFENKTSIIFGWLWAFWPHHTELYLWLSSRKDLLAIFFALFCTLYFLKALKQNNRFYYFYSFCFFVLSIFSKASFLSLPFWALFILALRKLWLKERKKSHGHYEVLFLFLCSSCSLFAGIFYQNFYSSITEMKLNYSYSYRIYGSFAALGKTILGWLWPSINILDVINWGDWLDHNFSYAPIGATILILNILLFLHGIKNKKLIVTSTIAGSLFLFLPISALIFPSRNLYSVRYMEPIFLVLFICILLAYKKWITNRTLPYFILLFLPLAFLSNRSAAEWNFPLKAIQTDFQNESIPLTTQMLADGLNYYHLNASKLGAEGRDIKQSLITVMAWLENKCVKNPEHYDNFDPCWLYYYHRYQLANSKPEKDFYSSIYLSSLRFYHQDFAIWREFEFAAQNGTLTEELAQKWLERYPQRSSVTHRIFALTAYCRLGLTALAQDQMHQFLANNLLLAGSLDAFISDWNPTFQVQIKACFKPQ